MDRKEGTTVGVLHGNGVVGNQWCEFIQKMFTEELPEECRDMNLDLITESVTNLGEDDVCNINNCEYKMLLLDSEVLKILKDESSILRRCEIMETQQEQVIVLLLGSEDDASFNFNARSTLSKLKDNEAYNIIQAKNPDQIFSDIITVLSPMYVVPHPNILSCEDKQQHLTLISNKPFPIGQHLEYIIEFSVGNKTKEAAASLFNPYTLLLQNPGHPPGLVTVKILICTRNNYTENNVPEISRTQMGEDLKVWFQSDLDKVYSALDAHTDPMAFLCQALHATEVGLSMQDRVDKLLTESFKKYVPDNKLSIVFGNAQNFGDDQDGNRAEYVPTLLHFSAMYGLRDLTAALLQCPGAVQAYGTANCDGDYPTNLAEKSGHWDLCEFMQTYMEVAAMVHNDYGDRGNMQTSQIMSSMVHGQYLSFAGEIGVPEDIYVPIGHGQAANLAAPGYLPMHPASHGTQLPQSVDYDYMIKRMLESEAEEPEKEYERIDFVEHILPPPLPTTERRGSAALTAKFDEPPPLPPPRDDKPQPSLNPQDAMVLLPNIHSNLSPAQEELISLQKKVKDGELTINQAVFRFKEWERKHKERAASFQYQQENLQRIRNSLMRSKMEKKQRGESGSIKISEPLVAGSSTYDKVLLKTRKEVMVENAYGHVNSKNTQGIRPSMGGSATPNEYRLLGGGPQQDTSSITNFGRGSLKKPPFGRPPAPIPQKPISRFRSSVSSQGSLSSSSSGRSSTSIPGVFSSLSKGSLSDDGRPPAFSTSPYDHRDGWSPAPADAPPPPVPPRDDPYGQRNARHQSAYAARPVLPPRSPNTKYR